MSNYISPKELNKLITAFQQSGRMEPELLDTLSKMFSGIVKRFKGANQEEEDLVQDCWVWFYRWNGSIDSERNPFSFITTCCVNLIHARGIKAAREPLTGFSFDSAFRNCKGLLVALWLLAFVGRQGSGGWTGRLGNGSWRELGNNPNNLEPACYNGNKYNPFPPNENRIEGAVD